ncbi:hypothetical protein ACFWXO_43730 [Kitasatospora sp. NPDC059088]|uniref:hypothetical protein n=1 Tax=Kitasatospora sp. NPDC059088 TaxID=3346722 RepID=UPI0036D02834
MKRLMRPLAGTLLVGSLLTSCTAAASRPSAPKTYPTGTATSARPSSAAQPSRSASASASSVNLTKASSQPGAPAKSTTPAPRSTR